MKIHLLLPIVAFALTPACGPTDDRPASTPPPPAPTTGCALAPNQTSNGLRMDCRVSGPLPDMLIDPLDSANTRCRAWSVSLFNQTINVPIRVVYGENGDESNEHVRLGATLPGGTHRARAAKSFGENCSGTIPPVATLNTRFAGRHIARIDKRGARACVFESRLRLNSYRQTTTVGLGVDTTATSRPGVSDALERRLDLELARAVNRLLKPDANVNASAFVNRSGRCADYRRFSGS